MVVGVEECQRLLLEDHEDGVEQFKVFCQVIKLSLGQLSQCLFHNSSYII